MFLYLLILVVGFASGEEEHCSKFHYEKKTLEMMIRMEIRMEEMQRKLDKLEINYEELNASVTGQPSTETKESTIAFFATKQGNKLYGAHQRIVFENVVTNIGDAYDPTIGTFRAPTSGTYVFFSTVLGYVNVELWNYIEVNDKRIANFNSRGTGGRHDDGTATVVLQLNTNDTVSVKNANEGGNTYGGDYTHFGGFLLQSKN